MPVEIRGVAELIATLGQAVATETLYPPMQRAVFGLQAGMANYPPEIPGSKYVRGYGFEGGPRTSERLGQSWTTDVQEVSGGVQGRVGTNVSYAQVVQGEGTQAAIHQGRWPTDQSEIERQMPIIVADFEDAIGRALA